MKILMISPQPFFTPRGTPLSVLGRLRALSRQGHEVHLLTYPMGDDVTLDGLVIHRVPFLPFLKSVRVGPSFTKLAYDVLLFFRAFFMLLKTRYDLIHTHEEAALFSLPFAVLFRTALLYDMHSNLPEQFGNFKAFNFRPIKAVFSALQYRTIKKSVFVITICPWLHNYVKGLIKDKPCALVENLLDGAFLGSVPEDHPQRLREALNPNGTPLAVHLGTLEHYQGLELLLETARLLKEKGKEIVFVIVGGEAGQIQKGKALAEEMGVADRVRFAGRVDPWEIPSFITLADILLSSRVSGTNTPSKIYGYLRSGKPIVATNLLTHTQVLTPEVALLVDKDPASIAEGIARLLEDGALGEELGRKARLLAQERYSQEKYFEIMNRVMEEVEGYVRDLRNGDSGRPEQRGKGEDRADVPRSRTSGSRR